MAGGPYASLTVHVKDDLGEPLPGVRVHLKPAESPSRLPADDPWKSSKNRPTGTTDTQGRVQFELVPVRDVRISVSLNPYRLQDSRPAELKLVAGKNEGEVVLLRPGAVEVQVVDENDGPVPGVPVSLRSFGPSETGFDGIVRFDRVPIGSYRPRPSDWLERSSTKAVVEPGKLSKARLVVFPGGWIEGRIIDERRNPGDERWVVAAMAGIEDEVSDLRRTQVPEDGRYRIGPIAPGFYRVVAQVAQEGAGRLSDDLPSFGSTTTEVRPNEVTEQDVRVGARSRPTTRFTSGSSR